MAAFLGIAFSALPSQRISRRCLVLGGLDLGLGLGLGQGLGLSLSLGLGLGLRLSLVLSPNLSLSLSPTPSQSLDSAIKARSARPVCLP